MNRREFVQIRFRAGCAVLALILWGCSQPTQGTTQKSATEAKEEKNPSPLDGVDAAAEDTPLGRVLLSLELPGAAGADSQKPLWPNFAAAKEYRITFLCDDGDDMPQEVLEIQDTLELSLKPGTWIIHAQGYLQDPEETMVLQGSVEVIVPAAPTQTLLVPIPLGPIPGDAPGVFTYQVDFPMALVRLGTLNLSVQTGDGAYSPCKTIDLLEAPMGTLAMAPGIYQLEITLLGDYSRATGADLLYVYPRLETKTPAYCFDETAFPLVLAFSDAGALKDYLALLPENTAATPYPVQFLGGNLSSKDNAGNTLKTIVSGLSRYVNLDLSRCVGDRYPSIATANAPFRANIVSLTLPESIRVIEANGFSGYAALVSVAAPGVESLGYGAFKNCANLQSLYMPGLTHIENATSSDSGAFRNCTALTSLTIPRLEQAGDYAFYNCSALSTVEIPAVTYLGKSAFRGAANLESLALAQVEYIGNNAFTGCTALNSIILGAHPPTLGGSSLFAAGMPTNGIQVPQSALADYLDSSLEYWTKALKLKVIGIPD